MLDAEHTLPLLDELRSMGMHLSIDDFGTGYSSLSALQQFPISTLKIDRSFVTNAATDPDDATIVRTIIEMGRSLGLQVIAEGIETEEQRLFLLHSGCQLGQGRLFGDAVNIQRFPRHAAAAGHRASIRSYARRGYWLNPGCARARMGLTGVPPGLAAASSGGWICSELEPPSGCCSGFGRPRRVDAHGRVAQALERHLR